MSSTSGIYWVDLGFINSYKESQLLLVLLRYSTDVVSAFPCIITGPLLLVSLGFGYITFGLPILYSLFHHFYLRIAF